jgi:hypothetical protein
MIAGIIVAAVLVVFFIGFAVEAGKGPGIVVVTGSANADACTQACDNFKRMRDQRVAMDNLVATQRALFDARSAEFNRVVLAIAALLAAAAVAALIPIVGAAVASGFLSAAAVLMVYETYLLGSVTALRIQLESALGQQARARTAEADALAQLRMRCSMEEVARCTSTP